MDKKEYLKQYYQKRKEKLLEKANERYANIKNDPDYRQRRIAYMRQYHAARRKDRPPRPPRQRKTWQQWYAENRQRYLEQKREYARTPAGRQPAIERMHRYIDNHPEISERLLEKCERWLRIAEGNYRLEASNQYDYRPDSRKVMK
jgi:hypothetical protein